MSTLNNHVNSFDLIIFSVTWNITDLNPFKLDSYDVLYNQSVLNQNDGLIILIKNNFKYNFSIENICDLKVMRIEVKLLNDTVLISAIYRLHKISENLFINELEKYFYKNNIFSEHIFLGDINIDIINTVNDAEAYLNVLLVQLINLLEFLRIALKVVSIIFSLKLHRISKI